MFKFNNTHIFTGYLKQLLSSFNLPTCRVYTKEFSDYLSKYGKEDPRVLESFGTIQDRPSCYIGYLKNDILCSYVLTTLEGVPTRDASYSAWKQYSDYFYTPEKTVAGLTRTLVNTGIQYDNITHEYLGDYLRFIRDYYNVNLMSMYNCFSDKICNNIAFSFNITPQSGTGVTATDRGISIVFNSYDQGYRIYAIPVKLFAEYTIAIDCDEGIEMFCGLYNNALDVSEKAQKLAAKTYSKINKTVFNQPVLYKKLNIDTWPLSDVFDINTDTDKASLKLTQPEEYTRWDIANREQDLKLFIKVPTSCTSSIVILEGDYRAYNNVKYELENKAWSYKSNRSVLNFNSKNDRIDLNDYTFKPISKLQLLAFNTGESYPFADRLVEYLSASAITPMCEIPDNIKRAQKVMNDNGYYFRVSGLWENKMQNILYDYIIQSGPIRAEKCKEKTKLVDKRTGIHPRAGYTTRSTLYDILGYVDKDTEKWYSSWQIEVKNNKDTAVVKNSIQNVDIYNGMYDDIENKTMTNSMSIDGKLSKR